MTDYKKSFESYASDYLLKKRALGDELDEAAHRAIEEIFAERGESLPPRPSKPVMVNAGAKSIGIFKMTLLLLLVLVSMALSKMVANTWVGLLVMAAVVVYIVFDWFRKRSLTPEQREVEKTKKQAEDEGLSELMLASAEGNMQRVQDLLNYGVEINATSLSRSTALMYAVRNNHLNVAKALIDAGADINAKSDKKSTALSIASKFGHSEIASYLKQKQAI
jgi:ankyrin repeat protein